MECAPDVPLEGLSHTDDEFIDESEDIEAYSVTLVTPPDGHPPSDDVNEEETGEAAENRVNPRQLFAIDRLEGVARDFLHQLGNIMHFCDTNEEPESLEEASSDSQMIFKLVSRRATHASHRNLSWPRKKGSTRSLAILFRVLDLCHGALLQNTTITKRELFYHDVSLFGKQSRVDDLIDDLAATFGVNRSDLNVTASPKGLVCGSATSIELVSGTVMTLSATEVDIPISRLRALPYVRSQILKPTLIPPGDEVAQIITNEGLGYVLVVEKEAVFQTLCASGFADSELLQGRGLIITGKGQPDVATREFVHTLGVILPESIPILLLVDADVYGLEIASVYKYGSHRMRHEAETLTCPRAEWIGVRGSEISSFGIHLDTLLPITELDYKKSLELLSRPDSVMPSAWKRELAHLLHVRRKAEIEIIATATFAKIPPPPSLLLSNNAPAPAGSLDLYLLSAWAALAKGPPLTPYLISKISRILTV